MPELRRDPVVGRWVIISTERARRPSDFPPAPRRRKGGPCVFCGGQEHRTPGEVWALRPGRGEPNTPGWLLRVVPNKFPALRIEGELEPRGFAAAGTYLWCYDAARAGVPDSTARRPLRTFCTGTNCPLSVTSVTSASHG